MKKSTLFLFTLFFVFSCTGVNDKNLNYFKGNWKIIQLYHKNSDLTLERYYEIRLSANNQLWMIKKDENREPKFINAKYKFTTYLDTLKLDVVRCEDDRLNANYNMYIDTISDDGKQYIIQLTLDSENTYIQAIRAKLKYQ